MFFHLKAAFYLSENLWGRHYRYRSGYIIIRVESGMTGLIKVYRVRKLSFIKGVLIGSKHRAMAFTAIITAFSLFASTPVFAARRFGIRTEYGSTGSSGSTGSTGKLNEGMVVYDPEETLTKEQEEEVLNTTEIEKYVKANYAVLQQFTNESEYTTRARQALVSYAMQFIGNPYVWGGTSLTNGADCSGFVQEIFKHFGIVTGRTSRDQYANCLYLKGREVMPGDLVFYADSTGYINHVAIYAGNYMIIHAANKKAGIKVNRYDYKQPYAYGRFIAN